MTDRERPKIERHPTVLAIRPDGKWMGDTCCPCVGRFFSTDGFMGFTYRQVTRPDIERQVILAAILIVVPYGFEVRVKRLQVPDWLRELQADEIINDRATGDFYLPAELASAAAQAGKPQ